MIKLILVMGVFFTSLSSILTRLSTASPLLLVFYRLIFFEQKDRGIAFGVLLVGPTLGLTVANKLGAALLTAYSWRTAFRTVGYVAIAIGILTALFIRNTKAQGGVKPNLLTGIKIVLAASFICS